MKTGEIQQPIYQPKKSYHVNGISWHSILMNGAILETWLQPDRRRPIRLMAVEVEAPPAAQGNANS